MSGQYNAPSVRKAFLMLRLISRSNQGVGISRLASQLNISKGTVHGIIGTLEALGAVIRDPLSKKFTLGPTLFELGKSAYAELDIRDLARPIMTRIMEQTGTSVFVGIQNGPRVTILDVVESNQDLKITAPRGSSLPFMAGALGKVFLTYMDDEEAAAFIRKCELPGFTKHTITHADSYLEQVQTARTRGYSTDDEEYISGVRAVAAPVQGKRGTQYAIWAVGFKTLLTDEKLLELTAAIQKAAKQISRRIQEQPFFAPNRIPDFLSSGS